MTTRTETPMAPRRILRWPEVHQRTTLSATCVSEQERAGAFPRRVKLTSRAVGWFEDEIEAFLDQRAAERDQRPQ